MQPFECTQPLYIIHGKLICEQDNAVNHLPEPSLRNKTAIQSDGKLLYFKTMHKKPRLKKVKELTEKRSKLAIRGGLELRESLYP